MCAKAQCRNIETPLGIATPVEGGPGPFLWQKLSASSSPHPPFYASHDTMASIFEQPRNAGTLCTSTAPVVPSFPPRYPSGPQHLRPCSSSTGFLSPPFLHPALSSQKPLSFGTS